MKNKAFGHHANTSSVLLFLFVSILVMFTFVACEPEEQDITVGNFRISPDGVLSVIDKSNVPAEVTIPSSAEGRDIKKIADKAFKDCTQIVSVTIENGIVEIGEYAFAGCTSLSTVSIPDSVTYYPYSVFDGCDTFKITYYMIPQANDGRILEYSEEYFDEYVLERSETKPVVVCFHAVWCTPCKKMLSDVLPYLVDQFGDEVDVGILDVDWAYDTCCTYGIMSIPALLVFKDREVVGSIVGLKAPTRIYDSIREFID